jgi:hypothetical protein
MSHDVFISHSSADKRAAEPLSAQGNYQFEGSDEFMDIQGKTTSIWKRQ